MIRLLKLEYSKWKNNSVIGILVFLYVIMMPTLIFLGKQFDNLPNGMPSNDVFFEFPTMWGWLGYAASWPVFFCLGLIAVFIVVNEVSYKTMRQNVMTGLTRKEFFVAKVLSVIVISILATLLFTVVGLVIGFVHTQGASLSDAFDNSWSIGRFFLLCMGYMSFGLFCGFVLRRSGVAVLFYLIYIIVLESILKWLIHFQLLNNSSVNFYPANSFEDLMPLPLFHFADAIPKKEMSFDFLLTYTEASISTIVWIIVFLGLSYWSMTRRDI